MDPRNSPPRRWACTVVAVFLGAQACMYAAAWAQTITVALPTPTIAVPLGGSASQSLTLNNPSGMDLGYRVGASGSVLMPFYETDSQGAGAGFRATVYTDPGVAGYQAQLAADDFSLSSSTTVASIAFQSFVAGATPRPPLDVAAQTLTFSVYPDAGGVPAGNPHNQTGTAIWSHTTFPTGPGVSIIATGTPPENRTELNLAAAGQSLTLPPGNYWLVVSSVGAFANRIAWYGSIRGSNGFATLTVDSTGAGAWALNSFPSLQGLAMRLNQSENCGASWLAVSGGDSGIAPANASAAVQLTASAGALLPGRYTTEICVASGPNGQRSLQRIPMTMLVYDPEIARKIPTLSHLALVLLATLIALLGAGASRGVKRGRR